MSVVLKWSPEGKMSGDIPVIFSGQRVKQNIFGGKTLLELNRTCTGAEDTDLGRMQLWCAGLSHEQIGGSRRILYQKKEGIGRGFGRKRASWSL